MSGVVVFNTQGYVPVWSVGTRFAIALTSFHWASDRSYHSLPPKGATSKCRHLDSKSYIGWVVQCTCQTFFFKICYIVGGRAWILKMVNYWRFEIWKDFEGIQTYPNIFVQRSACTWMRSQSRSLEWRSAREVAGSVEGCGTDTLPLGEDSTWQ